MEPNFTNPINNSATVTPIQNHKKVGPIIVTLVIVLVLIIAALYLFASKINQQTIPSDTGTADNSPAESLIVKPVTNNSTDVQSLDDDLNSATKGLDQQNL